MIYSTLLDISRRSIKTELYLSDPLDSIPHAHETSYVVLSEGLIECSVIEVLHSGLSLALVFHGQVSFGWHEL